MNDVQKQQHIALCLTKILLRHHPEYIFGPVPSGETPANHNADMLVQFCRTLAKNTDMFNQLQADDVNKIFHSSNQYID